MIVLSWNCRGLGVPNAIPNLRNLAQSHRPDILFLSETLSKAANMEKIRVLLQFDSCLSIDVEGRSGGLAVMWKNNINCRVISYARNFINMLIEDTERGNWRLTCYYGYPERDRRRMAWDLPRELRAMSMLPWCVIGDFNDLLSQEDKRGLHPHPNWLCEGFREVVSECDLTDICIEGYPYTWVKSRGSDHMIEERLDRALASSDWMIYFPQAKLVNLIASHSDHSPILLNCSPVIQQHSRRDFKFENSWLLEEEISEVVQDGWNGGSQTGVVHKLHHCASKLQRWGKRKRTRFREEIKGLESEIEGLRDKYDVLNTARLIQIQRQHAKILVQEEVHWRQRAKMHWLKEGDLNTKFFHMSATTRTRKKRIEKLQDNGNNVITGQQQLGEVVKKYFHDLFQSNRGAMEPVLSLINPRVSNEENAQLIVPITKEECRLALFQMHPDKSPGPDGFNPAFFQKFWHLCGDDVFRGVSEWLARGYFPTSLNETNICLIPKREDPISMQDYKPISLCNVLYKIVSKVLANRLKHILANYISEEQSAFVEGRSITDNALVAIEIIHSMKRRTRGTKGELALKIDISKAYDRVEWGFLKGMLEKLGFSTTWVKWMMLCVSSVNYSALVNYEKVGPIHPGRGLRQGDPLSPYLFIIITEGLTALIKNSIASGDLHGIRVCRGAPMVSHLLFADDCFIFCRATLGESRKLMTLLKIYEEASGQEINLSKSEVFFSKNLSIAAQKDLSNVMGVRHVLGTGTYLGLPSMIGRSKKDTFAFIKDRAWKRINSWRSRPMSKAGKEVMIKSVLQAIPAYVMSIYLLPESLTHEIERMVNAFWWGGGDNRRGIRWLAWDQMARPKSEGGLGFRDFHLFNKAMVAKQGWNLINSPSSLVSRILKARYFPHTSLLDSSLGNNPSFTWRSIWLSRHVLINGCRWSIGDGRNINIMGDPWLRESDGRRMYGPQQQGVYSLTISDLMLPNMKQWDIEKVNSLFLEYEVNNILAVPLLPMVEKDSLCWAGENNGLYTVRSGYRKMMEERKEGRRPRDGEGWSDLWKIQAPLKTKHLLWRICKECLPTRSRLRSRNVQCPNTCPLCESMVEEEWHLFLECTGACAAWVEMGLNTLLPPHANNNQNFRDFILNTCRKNDPDIMGRLAVLLWCIWTNRNNEVWNSNKLNARQVGLQAKHMWTEWSTVNELTTTQANNGQQRPPASEVQWQKPPEGAVKCNVDASFNAAAPATGWRWCVRDHNGSFLLAGTDFLQTHLTTLEGEAMALLEAMKHMVRRGYSKVIFESDSRLVVDAITTVNNGISDFSALISCIKSLLLMHPYFEVKFVRRQANMAAHLLARAACSLTSCRVYDSIPPCIATTLFNEMI